MRNVELMPAITREGPKMGKVSRYISSRKGKMVSCGGYGTG